MSAGTRFQLKQPTGWFAAGREVRCALELLSDATFKLFVWLCLHAERGRGGWFGEAGGHGDGGETLLPDERPTNPRIPATPPAIPMH